MGGVWDFAVSVEGDWIRGRAKMRVFTGKKHAPGTKNRSQSLNSAVEKSKFSDGVFWKKF